MSMDENWKFHRFRCRFEVYRLLVISLLFQSFHFCWSLNDEGFALLKFRERVVNDPFGALSNWNEHKEEIDPCFWLGVECSDGKVVSLNLKDLCLEGTLAPELKNLVHIKSIILRNNSFSGIIPEGIGALEELEVLDLGYNNFCGPLPADLGSNLSLGILLLDNNKLLGGLSPEIYELQLLSEFQVDENQLSNTVQRSCNGRVEENVERRQLQAAILQTRPLIPFASAPSGPSSSPETGVVGGNDTVNSTSSPSPPAFRSPLPSHPPHPLPLPPPASFPSDNPPQNKSTPKKNHTVVFASLGAAIFVIASIISICLWTSKKATVKPWATGLSGQLQKAFITGVPKLKRSEIEVACEDFSNVIGFSPIGPVYKGTLSSGVEIAVATIAVKSSKDWSNTLELQFRKKIETLSKINHKNFVNLIGYCEEEEPFCRMMVFEYAPNGTLFEHLYDDAFEHLDWRMRLRIAMGMAYALEYIHEQNPPLIQLNLTSSSVNLTEDYASKVSEFSLQNETVADERGFSSSHLLPSMPLPESNIYSLGLVLLELMTGKMPYSADASSIEEWAIRFLRSDQPLKELVDPSMASFQEDQLEQIGQLLRSCLNSNLMQRPTMKHISTKLRLITGITPDEAIPKLSPLWWAELEIASSEGR